MSRLTIKKGAVGANTLSGYEKCSALVGVFGLTKTDPVKLLSIEDAKAEGITPEDNALLYHHISEYFRMGGSGAGLWLLNLSAGTTLKAVIESSAVTKMIAKAEGNIFQIGFCFIPSTFANTSGLPTGFLDAIKAAQSLADDCAGNTRPLHVVLELAGYTGTSTAAADLRALTEGSVKIEAPQVSVVIGQDWDFAETLTGNNKKYAAVGSVLGCIAYQPVNFNIGEVQSMSLTNAAKGCWITAGLSNHEKCTDIESELSGLNTKGYIFGEYYSGKVVLNDDHNCVEEILDQEGNMNEASIALSRTNAKIMRELYKVYEAKLKSTYPVDTDGTLTVGMVKYFEGLGDKIFENMAAALEISSGETIVDKTSNLLTGDKCLIVSYNWQPTGCVKQISGTINIKKS